MEQGRASQLTFEQVGKYLERIGIEPESLLVPARAEADGLAGRPSTGAEADGSAGHRAAGVEASASAGHRSTGSEADGSAGRHALSSSLDRPARLAPLADAADAPARLVREATPDLLDELVRAHQTSIPFENLSVALLHEPVSLSVADLFDKVVTRRRGGFCFELNGLFEELLIALGFDASPHVGRVVFRDPGLPATHRTEVVSFGDELRLADVGFGGPCPDRSIPIGEGSERADGMGRFRMSRGLPGWWTLERLTDAGFSPVYHFLEATSARQDFLPLCWYASTHTASPFTQGLVVNLRTADGARSLTEGRFVRRAGEAVEKRPVAEADLPLLLEREFGIAL